MHKAEHLAADLVSAQAEAGATARSTLPPVRCQRSGATGVGQQRGGLNPPRHLLGVIACWLAVPAQNPGATIQVAVARRRPIDSSLQRSMLRGGLG